MSDEPRIPHHLNVERVLPGLEPGFAEQVLLLLSRGFGVVDAWGPVQMSVCGVVLERESLAVRFDSERGMTSVMLEYHGYRVYQLDATLAWARSAGAAGRERVPGYFPGGYHLVALGRRNADIVEAMRSDNQYLADVCEWFSTHDRRLTEWTAAERERPRWKVSPGSDAVSRHLKAVEHFEREWPRFLASLDTV